MCKAFLGHCGSLPVERFLSVYTMHPGRQPRQRLMLMDLGHFNISAITLHKSVETAAAERLQLLSRASVTRSSTKDCENRQTIKKDGVLSGTQQSNPLGCVFYGWDFFPMIFFFFFNSRWQFWTQLFSTSWGINHDSVLLITLHSGMKRWNKHAHKCGSRWMEAWEARQMAAAPVTWHWI